MNTVIDTTFARLPPARLSTWSICENTWRTCASKLLAMSRPSLSRGAVCPAPQTVRPPSVMTPGENARDFWKSVLSMYSAACPAPAQIAARAARTLIVVMVFLLVENPGGAREVRTGEGTGIPAAGHDDVVGPLQRGGGRLPGADNGLNGAGR